MKPFTFEREDRVYLVSPVAPIELTDADLEEMAFAQDVRKTAPNKHLMWIQGRYVEADRPNLNGAEWSAKELTIASLTPMLMPVTVMHDPRTAVGMIGDTKLVTPQNDPTAERARIDTTLGVWSHRFPEVAQEVVANYEAGSLMQSMEAIPAYYDCGHCGTRFPNLGGKEKAQWCACLRGENAGAAGGRPVRRLGAVTFTGTGLIFGTRGAKGAYTEAHLDVLAEEVAEFHARAGERPAPRKPKPSHKEPRTMEIEDSRYAELVAAEEKAKRIPELEAEAAKAAKVPELEQKVDKLEIDKKAAEDLAAAEKTKREQLEETARAGVLAGERSGKLGKAFLAKLPESIKTKLQEQAKTLSDEDWTARLAELTELTGVKHDEGGTGRDEDELTAEELAAAADMTGASSAGKAPTRELQQAVVGGLLGVLPKAQA